MKKHIALAALLCLIVSALVFAIAKHRTAALPQTRSDVRGKSLREQAKKAGSVTATARPTNLRRYDDMESLARESNVIVLGAVQSKASHLLAPAEKVIVTDYIVNANQVFKGELRSRQPITVRGPGGRVDFGDGTFAEVKLPDFWNNPEIGKSYVFFLEKREEGYFVLRGGPQGLFEVMPEGTIQPRVREEDQLRQRYKDKDAVSFYQELRRVAK